MSKVASVDETNKQIPVALGQETEVADFTGDAPPSGGLPKPEDKPYNPNRDRENVRSFVAKGLLILLLGTVAVSFICLSAGWISKEDLKDLLTIIFGPIITLLGAVTGFYYGEKSNSSN
jgi:hypothetical protein